MSERYFVGLTEYTLYRGTKYERTYQNVCIVDKLEFQLSTFHVIRGISEIVDVFDYKGILSKPGEEIHKLIAGKIVTHLGFMGVNQVDYENLPEPTCYEVPYKNRSNVQVSFKAFCPRFSAIVERNIEELLR
jgi:hypothetical protein